MSFLGNVFDFEKFNLKEMGRKVKDNPERLFLGAADPFSSKVWGGITGKDYEPIVDQWGGASADTYGKAENAGIDTKDGRKMHDAARAVAAFYTGQWAGGLMGGGGGTGSAAGGSGASGGSSAMSAMPMGMPGMGGGQSSPPPQMNAQYVPSQPHEQPQQPTFINPNAQPQRQAMANALGQGPDEERKRKNFLAYALMSPNGTT